MKARPGGGVLMMTAVVVCVACTKARGGGRPEKEASKEASKQRKDVPLLPVSQMCVCTSVLSVVLFVCLYASLTAHAAAVLLSIDRLCTKVPSPFFGCWMNESCRFCRLYRLPSPPTPCCGCPPPPIDARPAAEAVATVTSRTPRWLTAGVTGAKQAKVRGRNIPPEKERRQHPRQQHIKNDADALRKATVLRRWLADLTSAAQRFWPP